MTGGLLQLVTSGEQDIYLTTKPEITFFRKVYKRYTNFSLDFKEISPNQQAEYNENISFNIENLGDAIHQCYIKITLPTLSGFSDNIITNMDYINNKKNKISNIQNNIAKYQLLYTNLKQYIYYQTILLRKLKSALQITNITISNLQSIVILFNNQYSQQISNIKNTIDPNIITLIDISSYINKLNSLIGQNGIAISLINNQLDTRYNNMNYWIQYYYNKLQYYITLQTNMTNNNINFNWAEYLGHNFFEYFRLEIGGVEVNTYYNDFLHINQTSKIKQENQSNYLLMIGHDPHLNTFNNKQKNGRVILIPLIFWFCKDSGSVLPLIALQYQTVTITAKINKLKNIICFEDWKQMYNNLLTIDSFTYQDISNNSSINDNLLNNLQKNCFEELNSKYIKEDIAKFNNIINLDTNLPYSSYNINFVDRIINYKCSHINFKVLLYNFPQLLDTDINYILNNYGIPNYSNDNPLVPGTNVPNDYSDISNNQLKYSSNIMYLNHWIYFMTQLKSLSGKININNFGLYYPYIDYNLLYSQIPIPNISLICQFIYFDEIERKKFATSTLEYVIETIDQNLYDVNNVTQHTFSADLSFTKPTKELFWYIQPKIFNIGLSQYGQNTQLLFDYSEYFDFNIIKQQSMILDKYNIIINNNTTLIDSNNLIDTTYTNYYFNLLPYKYLSNNLPLGVYYHTFSLYPEETQPSGTANLSIIKGKQYAVAFDTNFLDEYFNNGKTILNNAKIQYNSNTTINYIAMQNNINLNNQGLLIKLFAKSYNMFVIENGHGSLLFTI
jgi:hypothetical protein